MTLQRRLQLLVASLTLVLLVVVTFMGVTASRLRRDVMRRDPLVLASGEIAHLAGSLKGQRDAAVTAEETDAVVARVAAAIGREPRLRLPFVRVRQMVSDWHTSGGDPAAYARAEGSIDALAEATRVVVVDSVVATARSRNQFFDSVIAATAAATVLLIIGSIALRRWVVVPIGQLHADIDAIGEGDIHRPVRLVGARDLMELGAAAERMRTSILRERDARERAGEAVDQDAPAVAALRELLAPAEAEPPRGLDIAATLLPAEGVLAGDWYDVTRRGDQLMISVGDVCGHGASTGISAVRTKFALLDGANLGLDPGASLDLAARRFGDNSDFVTAVVVALDAALGSCRYGNAGHPPPMLIDTRGNATELAPTGPLIGPFPGEWRVGALPFVAGDTLVLYSDGLTEARDSEGRDFGIKPVRQAVVATASASAHATLEEVVSALFRHCPDGLVDDVTIVVVRSTS